jgi:enoyl-CoA hydratase/carnithine racemase
MELVGSENKNGILYVTLNGSVTNPINPETTRALIDALSEASKNECQINALLLTSANNKFFSIGFDLPRLLELDRDGLAEFYEAFNELCLKLYSLPIPTMTAITGHCIAAGCIITACTDFRFMADGRGKIGVTATKLGLPVPFLARSIVHQLLGDEIARELLSTGNLYDINWAYQVKYISAIKNPDKLISASQEFLNKQIINGKDDFAKLKMKKIQSIKNAFIENKEKDAILFIDQWFMPEVQERLKDAVKKF